MFGGLQLECGDSKGENNDVAPCAVCSAARLVVHCTACDVHPDAQCSFIANLTWRTRCELIQSLSTLVLWLVILLATRSLLRRANGCITRKRPCALRGNLKGPASARAGPSSWPPGRHCQWRREGLGAHYQGPRHGPDAKVAHGKVPRQCSSL